jgi:hypothetical protein
MYPWWRVLGISTVAWLLVAVTQTAATFADRARTGEAAQFQTMLREACFGYLPWVPFSTILFLVLTRRAGAVVSLQRLARLFTAGAFVYLLPQVIYQVVLAEWDGSGLRTPLGTALAAWPRLFLFLDSALYVATFTVVAGIVVLLQATEGRERRRRLAEENLSLRLEVTQQRLAALRAQLEPHFLFNALTAIAALVREADVPVALAGLGKLSALLRYAVEAGDREQVTLAEELTFAREYLGLQQLRHGEHLRVEVAEADEAIDSLEVPPLLLQPLVENAVRHGIEADGVPGLVRVALRRVGNSLEVEVHNSRTEAAGDTGRAGVGLRATRDRLALTYGGRATLETRAEPDSFAAILRLPLNDHA